MNYKDNELKDCNISMKKISKYLQKEQSLECALIPAAGRGTRLLPATSVVPKELLPLGNIPMIHYAFERIIAAGISGAVVVLSPSKELIQQYLNENFSDKIKITFVIQKEPTGLADAISLCHTFIKERPFLLWMPDGFYWGDHDFLPRLIHLFNRTGKTSLSIYPVSKKMAHLYGNCGRIRSSITADGYHEIKNIGDKQPGFFEIHHGISAYRGTGVSVCTAEFFDFITKSRSIYTTGELDDVPVFQMILKERGIVGEIFKGVYIDVGNQRGFMYAQHFLWDKKKQDIEVASEESIDSLRGSFEMIVFGCGTAVPQKERFAPGYALRVDDNYLLFDPSAGTLHRAVQYGINLDDVSHIFFTHLHPDHTGDLVPILFALKNPDLKRSVPLQIVGPPQFRNYYNKLIEIYGHWIEVSQEKAVIYEIPSDGLNNRQWSISWKPLIHAENSIGYRVVHKETAKVWAYSGDTDYCEELISLVYDADVAVLECSFPDQFREKGHLTPSLAGRVTTEGRVHHAVLSHFYPKCEDEEVFVQCRKEYAGQLTIATDYLRIAI